MPVPPLNLDALQRLDPSALAAFLAGRRWFAGRTHRVSAARFVDATSPGTSGTPDDLLLTVLEVDYADAPSERYGLPLACPMNAEQAQTIGHLEGVGPICDGLAHPQLGTTLLKAIARSVDIPTTRGGVVSARPTTALQSIAPDAERLPVRASTVEQSHSLLRCGDLLGLKLYRKLEIGTNLDLEVGRFLTEIAGFSHTPPVAGWIEYRPTDPTLAPTTLALLQGWVANQGTGWDRALKIRRDGLPAGDPGNDAALLGRRTAELHLALAGHPEVTGFERCPITTADLDRWHADAVAQFDRSFELLKRERRALAPEVSELAEEVLLRRAEFSAHLDALRSVIPSGQMSRIHGDYHLGQTLRCGDDYVLLDFEGEPLRPLSERRRPTSPLKDVAGMLRSFDYARNAVDPQASDPLVEACYSARTFVLEHDRATRGAPFRMADPAAERNVMRAFLVEKAAYELQYELSHRPDWVFIPLGGLHSLLSMP